MSPTRARCVLCRNRSGYLSDGRRPSTPPSRPRLLASENSTASAAKSSPPRARRATSSARACRRASSAALAPSGTATRIMARFRSTAPGRTPVCSRMKVSTSASVTRSLGSISRSRRRASSTWLRTSSRKSCTAMPSCWMRWYSCSTVASWFWRAMDSSACASAPSSTFRPVSRAYCSCARSAIRRSSISLRSTSAGGWGPPRSASWRWARAMRARTSLLVTGSVLTTATMKSASRGAALAGAGAATAAAAAPAGAAAGAAAGAGAGVCRGTGLAAGLRAGAFLAAGFLVAGLVGAGLRCVPLVCACAGRDSAMQAAGNSSQRERTRDILFLLNAPRPSWDADAVPPKAAERAMPATAVAGPVPATSGVPPSGGKARSDSGGLLILCEPAR